MGLGSTALETTTSAAAASSGVGANVSTSSGILPRGLVLRLIRIPTLAEKLPLPLFAVATNGKIAALVFVASYMIFLLLWFPFWLLSCVIGEIGIYVLAIGTVFFVGRCIIRLIAFPGASQKVANEIETEFAKYSVKMIALSCECIIEVATVIAQTSPTQTQQQQQQQRQPQQRAHSGLYDLPVYWRRVMIYRDRVLGVYLDVLLHLYRQPQPAPNTLSDLTRFGNNRIREEDDIGDLSGLTPRARSDGRDLLEQLKTVVHLLDELERQAKPVLEAGLGPTTNTRYNQHSPLTVEAGQTAQRLVEVGQQLRDFVASLKRRSSSSENDNSEESSSPPEDDEDDENLTVDAMRRRFEETSSNGSTTSMAAIKSGLASILPMLDPPPHTSIFGFDVLRGCVVSRYRGARQMWVQRPQGGRIDVLHFPAPHRQSQSSTNPTPTNAAAAATTAVKNTKAVLYCNPNAGLVEVATGMSLVGGNVPSGDTVFGSNKSNDTCWTDFYTENGLDVYVFNYAGYGRSYGTTFCVPGTGANPGDNYHPGCWSRLVRIFKSTFLTFTPTPASLRADGIAVAQHLLHNVGVQQLVVHGESIGGVAASAVGRYLSNTSTNNNSSNKVSLLICDRTFCNLEAVAQRLVGGWSGYAIRALAPFWDTDVAGDFVAAGVPKVVASDAADAIIADAASLKSGIALWKEIRRGVLSTTKDIAWIIEPPLQYRMAEWENVCVNDSKYVAGGLMRAVKSPVWPADKRITVEEAFHFAACCTRIGKLAKQANTGISLSGGGLDDEAPMEFGGMNTSSDVVFEAWKVIACCDGLTGAPLGMAVRRGFDWTVAWLCSVFIYGNQAVAASAATRRKTTDSGPLDVIDKDFDRRPPGYENDEAEESEGGVPKLHPKPLPEVITQLTHLLEAGDQSMSKLSHEFQFVLGMLHYAHTRLVAEASKRSLIHEFVDDDVGFFLNLHCGHNNAFSRSEKQQLKSLLDQALTVNEPTRSAVGQISVV